MFVYMKGISIKIRHDENKNFNDVGSCLFVDKVDSKKVKR